MSVFDRFLGCLLLLLAILIASPWGLFASIANAGRAPAQFAGHLIPVEAQHAKHR